VGELPFDHIFAIAEFAQERGGRRAKSMRRHLVMTIAQTTQG
jgi:hypothetical protein